MRARIAWILFGVTVLLAAGQVALLVASERPVFSGEVIGEGFPLVTVGALAGALVGAVIVSRYPGHPIGWLFVVGQLISELGVAMGAYGYSALSGELGSAPGGHLAIWLSIQAGGLFVVTMLAVLFLLAPDGRLASPRWRVALAFPLLGLATSTVAVASLPPGRLTREKELVGGVGTALELTLIGSFLAVGIGVVAGAASVVRRLRRASDDERQQLRWFALAAVTLAIGVVTNLAMAAAGAPGWAQPVPLMVAYICIPVFTGVAILRHRLYDIDLFLNRAITLAALTGFVTLGYIAVVVLIGTLAPLTQDAFWPSLLATAVVALAFQPVRKRAERLADRLVYGARAAPYIELAEFSRRLQESPGPQALLQQVSEAVARAVGAHAVAIRVDVPGAPPEQASWPEDVSPSRAPGRVLPVVEGDERLGELAVAMPPGTDLRPEEERLLSDFAVQLGRAFRNMRLESALLARVEQLQASTVALEESARRLTMAQEAERARFESNLARTVVPHLHRVREGVRRLRDELPCPPETGPSATGRPVEPLDPAPGERVAQQIDEMTEHTQTALESLRTLTRRVFPMQLARHGLGPALSAHLRGRDAAALEADPSADRRFEPYVESAAYFCAVEILRELDGPVTLRLAAVGDLLALEVVARGPVPAAHAIGHLHDRAAALGGQVLVTEADGEIRFRLELPLSSAAEPVPDLSQPV